MAEAKFSMNSIDSRLSAVYTSEEGKQQHYDDWAAHYDNDLVEEMQYVAHVDAAKAFTSLDIGTDTLIVDVACGTGLAGIELAKAGYQQLHGADFSQEMLKIAAERGVYQELFEFDVVAPCDREMRYDALICVGLFSFSVPRVSAMINVINLVKPGAPCVITVNGAAWRELGLDTAIAQEAAKHRFTIEQIIKAGYIERENIDSRILVIRAPDPS